MRAVCGVVLSELLIQTTMMNRKVISATLATLLAFAAIPASSTEPSLLKMWVWFELGGNVALGEIKQDSRGVVQLEKGEHNSAIEYSVADPANCIIRQTIPSLSTSTLIYLNNFLPEIRILRLDNGATDFAVSGLDHTHCTKEARGTFCMDELHFHANDEGTFNRMKQALDSIFSKFCSYAGQQKTPSVGGEWQTSIK